MKNNEKFTAVDLSLKPQQVVDLSKQGESLLPYTVYKVILGILLGLTGFGILRGVITTGLNMTSLIMATGFSLVMAVPTKYIFKEFINCLYHADAVRKIYNAVSKVTGDKCKDFSWAKHDGVLTFVSLEQISDYAPQEDKLFYEDEISQGRVPTANCGTAYKVLFNKEVVATLVYMACKVLSHDVEYPYDFLNERTTLLIPNKDGSIRLDDFDVEEFLTRSEGLIVRR